MTRKVWSIAPAAPVFAIEECKKCGLTTTLTTCVPCEWLAATTSVHEHLRRLHSQFEAIAKAFEQSKLTGPGRSARGVVFRDIEACSRWMGQLNDHLFPGEAYPRASVDYDDLADDFKRLSESFGRRCVELIHRSWVTKRAGKRSK